MPEKPEATNWVYMREHDDFDRTVERDFFYIAATHTDEVYATDFIADSRWMIISGDVGCRCPKSYPDLGFPRPARDRERNARANGLFPFVRKYERDRVGTDHTADGSYRLLFGVAGQE